MTRRKVEDAPESSSPYAHVEVGALRFLSRVVEADGSSRHEKVLQQFDGEQFLDVPMVDEAEDAIPDEG
jgi:hypothetical protein